MTVGTIILITVLSMIAAVIQRVSGFGFGVFVMTALPMLMPSFGEATALSGLLSMVVALVPAITHRRHLHVRKLIVILLTFLLVSFVGIKFVNRVDSGVLRRVLGGVLVVVAVYLYFCSSKVHIRPNAMTQVGLGTLSGAMGGLFAMQGPPAVIYFLGCAESKDEYIALTQWYFLIGNAMMSVFRATEGFVTPVVGELWCFGVVGVAVGLFVGAHIYKRINAEVLKHIVYGYMALSGLWQMFF